MVKRMVADHQEFVYLSHGVGFASVGDVGLVSRIKESQVLEDGRALLVTTFTEQVCIMAHWVEPGTGGLAYCLCVPSQVPSYTDLPRPLQIRALTRFGAVHSFCRSSRDHRYTVHTQRGFLNVHLNSDDPFDTTNIISQLQDGDQVVVDNDQIGPPPFFWARLVEPVAGYVVSSTGNFEWLEPLNPPLMDFKVSLSFHSLSTIIEGTQEQIAQAKALLLEGTKIAEMDLRIQTVLKSDRRMSLSDYCRSLNTIVEEDEMSDFVCQLSVVEAFAMPLSGAQVSGIPERGEVDARIARSLVLKWMDEFRNVQTAGPYYHRVWDRLTQAPDGDIRGYPHFARVTIGESSFFCHRDLCFLDFNEARNALRRTSIVKNWDQLRLVFIGMADPESFFTMLPLELIQNIASMVAPFAFLSPNAPAKTYSE